MRRILILCAAAMLALGMAGCGGGEEPAEERPAEEETAGTAEEEVGEAEEADEEAEPVEEAEAAGSAVQAIPIEEGTTEGVLEADRDEIWYTFELPGSGIMELTFAPGDDTEKQTVAFLDSEQDQIWREWDVRPPSEREFRYVLPAGDPQTFFVRVSQGRPGSFDLELRTSMQDDAGSGGDAGENAVSAVEVEPSGTVSGMVADGDESDWYAFDLEDGEVVDVSLTPGDDAEKLTVALYDTEQNREWREWDVATGVTESYTLQLGAGDGGTYYVEVSQGRNGSYELTLDAYPQDDAGSGGDAGDRPVDALPVDTLEVITGRVAGYDEDDLYSLDIEEGETFTAAFTPGDDAEKLTVAVLGPDQDRIWREWDVGGGVTEEFTLPEDSPAGPYYLQVSQGRDGDYTIEIR
ncbi:MAG: hypothetical protein R6U36_09655 [Candidatus Fermentibacteraceae bacterium]